MSQNNLVITCSGRDETVKLKNIKSVAKLIFNDHTKASTYPIRAKPTHKPENAKGLAFLAPRLDTLYQNWSYLEHNQNILRNTLILCKSDKSWFDFSPLGVTS